MPSESNFDDQPLGLTVHSLPPLAALADDASARTRTGRWKMLLVLLICAAPVVASYTAYYLVRPEGRRNYGALIEPQRPLPEMAGSSIDGQPFDWASLKDQWLLISVANAACDAACSQHLYYQRQLRESLGKDKDRLEWVWMIPDAAPVPEALRPALRSAKVVRVPADALARWLEPETGHALADHLYVVDPLGHWMMRFPSPVDQTTAPKIKSDLERLMRASEGWHKVGS